MPFEDKTIQCAQCDDSFVHSADDQARYAERGFTNEPKRCPKCRAQRRGQGGAGGGGGGGGVGGGGQGGPREVFEAVCAECGVTTTVPFKPTQDRPVYCRDCYRSKRGN